MADLTTFGELFEDTAIGAVVLVLLCRISIEHTIVRLSRPPSIKQQTFMII
jgi:hypothetical protein